MRYAILGDIHGNWPALNTVLNDAMQQGVTRFASVGDIAGYNPDPVRCIDMIRDMECLCVMGNHDYFCTHDFGRDNLSQLAAAGILWTRQQLGPGHARYLDSLERAIVAEHFTLVHDSLDSMKEWHYVTSPPDAARSFARQETQVCFNGHTHVPMIFEFRDTVTVRPFRKYELDMRNITAVSTEKVILDTDTQYLINAGSVGQPRDRDPRAAYLIFDPDQAELEIRRLPYDIEATRRRIAAAHLPQWLGARLGLGV